MQTSRWLMNGPERGSFLRAETVLAELRQNEESGADSVYRDQSGCIRRPMWFMEQAYRKCFCDMVRLSIVCKWSPSALRTVSDLFFTAEQNSIHNSVSPKPSRGYFDFVGYVRLLIKWNQQLFFNSSDAGNLRTVAYAPLVRFCSSFVRLLAPAGFDRYSPSLSLVPPGLDWWRTLGQCITERCVRSSRLPASLWMNARNAILITTFN